MVFNSYILLYYYHDLGSLRKHLLIYLIISVGHLSEFSFTEFSIFRSPTRQSSYCPGLTSHLKCQLGKNPFGRSCGYWQGSVLCWLSDYFISMLDVSWKLPSVLCHMCLSTEQLTTWQLAS